MPSTKRSFNCSDTTDVKRTKYELMRRIEEAERRTEEAVRRTVEAYRKIWNCVMVQVQIMNLYPRPENVRKIESEHRGYYQSHIEYDLPKKKSYYVLQRLQDKHCYDVRFKSTWETRNLMQYLKNPPSCICPVYRPPKSYFKMFGDLKITYL